MAESTSLLRMRLGNWSEGSNPSLSATLVHISKLIMILNTSDKIIVCAESFLKSEKLCAIIREKFSCVTFASHAEISDPNFFGGGVKAIICGKELVDERFLKKFPELRVISKYGVGLDAINMEACEAAGVKVLSRPGVNKRCVAELALGYMLMLFHNIPATSSAMKRGEWIKNGGRNLENKTIGILGLGNIGMELLQLLVPLNVQVLGVDIVDKSNLENIFQNLTIVDLNILISKSDLISIHTPLTSKTAGLFSEQLLSKMKKGAYLINTARGGIVDEVALEACIINGAIGGAALDVYSEEPNRSSLVTSLDNVLASPHIGGNSEEAVDAMGRAAIEMLLCEAEF